VSYLCCLQSCVQGARAVRFVYNERGVLSLDLILIEQNKSTLSETMSVGGSHVLGFTPRDLDPYLSRVVMQRCLFDLQ
jgi:hypothetical protein